MNWPFFVCFLKTLVQLGGNFCIIAK